VLRALNEHAPCSVLDVHRATGISRQAIYRAVDHLGRHGYVQRIPGDGRIRLTSEVRALSAGYRDDDWIVEAGAPVLEHLQREVRWPTSLATADKGRMVVRETTRYRSPFVFDTGSVGLRLPILASSLGLAYLAFCDHGARQIILGLLRRSSDRWDAIARDAKATGRLLRTTVQRGYGYRQGGLERQTSSVAVPIILDEGVVGSICVTFAKSSLTQSQAAAQFVPPLREAADEIRARAARSIATR
jgi:IclR family mhp operon transcriptional activator